MSLFQLFKREQPLQNEQCSFCKGEGVVEWNKITVINQERSILTPYLFHCTQCNGNGKIEVKNN